MDIYFYNYHDVITIIIDGGVGHFIITKIIQQNEWIFMPFNNVLPKIFHTI